MFFFIQDIEKELIPNLPKSFKLFAHHAQSVDDALIGGLSYKLKPGASYVLAVGNALCSQVEVTSIPAMVLKFAALISYQISGSTLAVVVLCSLLIIPALMTLHLE